MELTATQVWSRIAQASQEVLPEQTFATWLASTEAIALTDETLVVGAPTKFAVEWIEDKYGELLRELAEREIGRPLQVRFEHHGQDERLEFPELGQKRLADEESVVPDVIGVLPQPAAVGLNDRYTFDRFVIGGHNQLATAACRRVADAPATAYNPLFIYGDTGLGKTHLMHAIGHAILERLPDRRVVYTPSEQFMNEMIAAIQSGRTALFRQRYRQVDVLLVDDVHFLGNKEGTQEEFFHTFNTLYDAQKQIIITSDRPPAEIPGLQERLVSRFEWGLVTDIKPPDFETRVAILQKKAEEDGLYLDEEVIEYIARMRKNSVRQLEGAVIKLLAFSSLTRREISLDLAREALGSEPESTGPDRVRATPQQIVEQTAELWNVTVDDMKSKRRTRTLVVPRQVAMYLIKTTLDLPYTDIGSLFGGRDHSTVIHSVNKVEAEMAGDPTFRSQVRKLQQMIAN
ncbi:MAG: chromosomal replication initiator protein DnaA [Planctomycetota bacterium]|jgi:chromosomal replication initiator protein